eukprot:7886760-Prorocentrum_lima.AAC.1
MLQATDAYYSMLWSRRTPAAKLPDGLVYPVIDAVPTDETLLSLLRSLPPPPSITDAVSAPLFPP